MKRYIMKYGVKLALLLMIIFMLMYVNKGDIQYIYANF